MHATLLRCHRWSCSLYACRHRASTAASTTRASAERQLESGHSPVAAIIPSPMAAQPATQGWPTVCALADAQRTLCCTPCGHARCRPPRVPLGRGEQASLWRICATRSSCSRSSTPGVRNLAAASGPASPWSQTCVPPGARLRRAAASLATRQPALPPPAGRDLRSRRRSRRPGADAVTARY